MINVRIEFDFDRNMQFGDSRSRRKSKPTKLEGTENAGKYVHGLQMYKVPPTDNITLEEFEEFAIDRLKGTWACKQEFILSFKISEFFSGSVEWFFA